MKKSGLLAALAASYVVESVVREIAPRPETGQPTIRPARSNLKPAKGRGNQRDWRPSEKYIEPNPPEIEEHNRKIDEQKRIKGKGSSTKRDKAIARKLARKRKGG